MTPTDPSVLGTRRGKLAVAVLVCVASVPAPATTQAVATVPSDRGALGWSTGASSFHSTPQTDPDERVSTSVDPPPVDPTVAVSRAAVATVPGEPDPLAPVTSPDIGEHCADGLDALGLTAFFSRPIGDFEGSDYQRAFRLDDGRVLWTFQDAFLGGSLVHNVGMIQSGRCFSVLNDGRRSWLLADATSHMMRWHWILDGAMDADGSTFHLFVAEMTETGSKYLDRTRPTALRRVVLDTSTLEVIDVAEEDIIGDDLFGWSVTSDARFTYLYSHCFQQFGHATSFGVGECAVDVKLARLPRGSFDAPREYWTGEWWSTEPDSAVPVVDGTFVFSGNNPAQVRFDGARFVLVEKRDDWWGRTVEIGVADAPHGPFRHVASIDEPLKCDRSECNTYFAAWVPWREPGGSYIWSVGHNVWSGRTAEHLRIYRPTFHAVDPAVFGSSRTSTASS